MYELRPYQQQAVAAALEHLEKGKKTKRGLIVAPTASGKSLIIANVAQARKKGVLVLQPTKELLYQNYNKFLSYGGQAGVYSASMNRKDVSGVTFATIGSVAKVPYLFDHVRDILIDEGHEVPPDKSSQYIKFLSCFDGVRVVGLTATAFRLKRYVDPWTSEPYARINLLNRETPRFFNHFLHVTQISELYEQGYLAPLKYLPMAWDAGQLRYKPASCEYSDASIDDEIKRQGVLERIPDLVQQSIEKGRKHRLVFVRSVADAMELAGKVPSSIHVSGDTPIREREEILEAFMAGDIKTVFNVGVLTTGFDFPALDTAIIARPTASLALYMQMIGRVMRTSEEKEYAAVVDMCGNYARFGRVEDIKYLQDAEGKWLLHNGRRQLSGVRL